MRTQLPTRTRSIVRLRLNVSVRLGVVPSGSIDIAGRYRYMVTAVKL